MPRLPDFSVVVWLRKTDKFAALKTEVLDAAVAEPYESTEYQGMVGFAGLPSSLEHIRAGKLRPLAVATATRLEALPDIPTVGDFVPGYEASGWTGIGVPTNTPADIVDKINNAINAGLADSKIKARLADLGSTVVALPPAEFRKFIANETEKWAKVVKFSGAKPE